MSSVALTFPALAFLVALSFFAGDVAGYKYDVKEFIPGDVILSLTEGPMWAPSDAPWGTGDSYISADFYVETTTDMHASDVANVVVLMFDDGSLDYVGDVEAGESRQMCCEPGDVDCTPGEVKLDKLAPGYDPRRIANATVRLQVVEGAESGIGAANVLLKHHIAVSDEQRVIVLVCDATSDPLPVRVTGTLKYKNPYGFLPGAHYAFPFFYAALTTAYALLMLVYLISLCRNRAFLLPLQYCVFVVIVCGFLEVLTWTITFVSKNSTAKAPCCPVTADIIVGVVLSVFKKGLSRWLLLAVSLGFGVVHQRLDRKSFMYISILTLVYVALSLNVEIRYAVDTNITQSAWEFPLFITDMIFLFCINMSLSSTLRDLQIASQQAKLEMYLKLRNTLIGFVVVWFFFTIFVILTAVTVLKVQWEFLWAVNKFWEVAYFGILLVICRLWAPGEQSYQYAWYAQPSALDAEAQGVEMGGITSPGGQPDHFGLGDSDSDGDMGGGDSDGGQPWARGNGRRHSGAELQADADEFDVTIDLSAPAPATGVSPKRKEAQD